MIESLPNAAQMWQGRSLVKMLHDWDSNPLKWRNDRLIAQIVGDAKRVADLGCGDGRLATLLPNVEEYKGYDSSPDMIEAARKRCARLEHASFGVCDVFRESALAHFDVAVLYDVAIHQKAPLRAVQTVLDLWSADRYVFTLLVGPVREELQASVVVSSAELRQFVKGRTRRYHRKRVANERFDFLVLEIMQT